METIRIANVRHFCAIPYRALAHYDFVRYQENDALENGRKLHEGEVDLALISAAEFANHGGYVGLDFGVGCRDKSDSIMLYSNATLQQMSKVHFHQAASSSAILLRILLAGLWQQRTELSRSIRHDLLDRIEGRQGAMILHELPIPHWGRFETTEDLVSAWCRWTKKPYVSLIWAMRPDSLRADHLQFCNEIFHRSIKARVELASTFARTHGAPVDICVDHVSNIREYFFDQSMLDGLGEIFSRGQALGVIPPVQYSNVAVGDRSRSTRPVDSLAIAGIISRCEAGFRLGIGEGVKLAFEASLAELGASAEVIRKRCSSKRTVQCVVQLDEPSSALGSDGTIENLLGQAQAAVAKGFRRVKLPILARFTSELSLWEALLRELKSRFPIVVEGCSVFEFRWIAAGCRCSPTEVVQRIIGAGLDVVSGEGGDMLVDRVNSDSSSGFLTVKDWLDTIRLVHSFGGSTNAILQLNPRDSWEDRLLHLHKIRSLQDEVPGFPSFTVRTDSMWRTADRAEAKMRGSMLARLFLDNIASLQESELLSSNTDISPLLGLASGCDSVRIVVGSKSNVDIDILRELSSIGLEIDLAGDDGLGGNGPTDKLKAI